MLRIGLILGTGLLAAGLACAAAGVLVIAPGEVGVVRRLGRVLPAPWTAGPHWRWPLGIDRVDRVRIDAVRRLEVGAAEPREFGAEPGAGEFLTGDRNLLRARAVVQYRVADPLRFALGGPDAEATLMRLAESSLAAALAGRSIDAALGPGKVELAATAAERLGREAERLGLGIAVLGVGLTEVRPPSEVGPDFAAAQAARSDRDRRLVEARTRASTSRTEAGAEARGRIDRARAEADREVRLAQARAERFLALLAEAGANRRLTVGRIYRDALDELLPRVGKVVLTPEEPVDLSLFGVETGAPRERAMPEAAASK